MSVSGRSSPAAGPAEPERAHRDLHRGGEAGVEVEAGDVVDADARGRRARRAPAIPIAGDSAERRALGEEVVVVRVGAGEREHHPVVRARPRPRAASYEQSSSAAAWSTSMLAHISFGYGNVTIRFVVGDGADLRRRCTRCATTRAGSGAATAANPLHSSRDVLAGAPRCRGPRRRAARSRTAGTPASARARGAPSRRGWSPAGRRPRPSGHGGSSASVHSSQAFGSARRARQRV